MKRLSLKTAAMLIAVGCLSFPVRADTDKTDKPRRQITVQGEGKQTAVPDQARLSVAVTEKGAAVDTVTQQVRRTMEAVMKAIRKQGVADKDVQTRAYQVLPQNRWDKGRMLPDGYLVENRVEVLLKDPQNAGTVIAAVLDAGANSVNGPTFEFSNPQLLARQALEKAMADARSKADIMARAAGATLGEVQTITENNISVPGPQPRMFRTMAMAAGAAPSAPEPVAAGEETVQAGVTVTYALH